MVKALLHVIKMHIINSPYYSVFTVVYDILESNMNKIN